MEPRKRIYTVDHLKQFIQSPTCDHLLDFLRQLGESVKGVELMTLPAWKQTHQQDETKRGAFVLLEAIEECSKGLKDFPAELDKNSRFGSKTFREWHSALIDGNQSLMTSLAKLSSENTVEDLAMELKAYWLLSFGSTERLDYGTGHEATFLVFLYILWSVDVLDSLTIASVIIPQYLNLTHLLLKQYRIEPAGSHGAWSLDDYAFIPFILGASQLQESCPMSPKRFISSVKAIDETSREKYLYFDYIAKVDKEKFAASFQEHSPLLVDIHTRVRKWSDIYDGYLYMYKGEVLGKFPVVQHFLFSKHFPSTWQVGPGEEQAPTKSPFLQAQLQQSVVPGRPGSTDLVSKYFNTTQHNNNRPALSLSPSSSSSKSFKHKNWKFEYTSTRIFNAEELENLKTQHATTLSELDFPPPEMFFGHNKLCLEYETANGVELRCVFDGINAIKKCKSVDGQWDRKMFKVKNQWKDRTDQSGNPIKPWRSDYDWTYTTTAIGEYTQNKQDITQTLASTEETINYELLKQREPILFFGSVELYEDDLFDNGISNLSVKLRVMDSCFFILQRFWLRVDNQILRIFDTRVFHQFGSKSVIIEVTQKEAEISELSIKDHRDMMKAEQVVNLLPSISTMVYSVKI